ncbi:hypothetical protein BH23PAT2_BH23PAT2_02950 [soil metagenome]
MHTLHKKHKQSGSIIVSLLIIITLLGGFIYGLAGIANSTISRSRQRIFALQSQYAAESGADAAVSYLNQDSAYTGTSSEVELLNSERSRATFEATVSPGGDEKERIITATGNLYVPASAGIPTYTHTIEVTVARSSDTAASALLSRNIIDVQSGVKRIRARDIYANGYIHLNRNTTDLIAENIIVADRNTGPDNCSIGGTGNLIKPDSFSDPAQTKTTIRTAFNNCLSPPGNSNTTNFDVFPNQTNIPKVQSTFIPWSDIMDNTYANAPGGCSDWTTGGSPRTIPSSGNDKLTHYPDTQTGVAGSCGNSGNIDLGSTQYNITDHVHIRANLCGDSGCTPTFFNPNPEPQNIKFVFVEGWINFDRLTTAPGSGAIVFISSGSDPAAKTSRCPLGGSVFLGNDGDTSAPAAFLLANNGVCLDRTRFGSEPALGGISGKNIYIATNPGTPFDLELDPTFPVEEIPIDLSWRAVRFRRL